MSKQIAFGWYGGKYSHLDWLLPLLPQTTHFCDVYGGSAAVLINRPPALVETYNDIDSELVNFFSVLREQKDQLIENIGLTPFSREELFLACQPLTLEITKLERSSSSHGLSPNRIGRTLGALCADQSRWYGRCSLKMAWIN
jgi:DNA adenine methylase